MRFERYYWPACGLILMLACIFIIFFGWNVTKPNPFPENRPYQITGPSMAPTLLGEHLSLTCEDCGFVFAADAHAPPPRAECVCPNCGWNKIAWHDIIHPGEQVQLANARAKAGDARKALSPQRGELAIFRLPDRRLSIKRVIGLPGETITIEDGEILIDGVLWQKSLDQLRASAVLVYDDRSRSRQFGSRWQPVDMPTEDKETEDGWHRLRYEHWRCFRYPGPRNQPSAVLDHYGYNQATSRSLHPVSDLYIKGEISLQAGASIRMHLHDATVQLREKDGGIQWNLEDTGWSSPREFATSNAWIPFEFGVCDGRVFVSWNGNLVAERPIESAGVEGSRLNAQESPRIELAGRKPLRVRHLQLYRDIYYLPPLGKTSPWSAEKLGLDEYFVLGDNPPRSSDSRQWRAGSCRLESYVGDIRKQTRK